MWCIRLNRKNLVMKYDDIKRYQFLLTNVLIKQKTVLVKE